VKVQDVDAYALMENTQISVAMEVCKLKALERQKQYLKTIINKNATI